MHYVPSDILSIPDVTQTQEQAANTLTWEWELSMGILRLYAILLVILILSKYCFRLRRVSYLCELILSFLTFAIASPIVILGILVTFLCRSALTVYFNRKYNGRVKLMSGNDAFWAYDEYANCCYFTALYVLQGECSMKKVRARFINNVLDKVVDGEEIYGVFRNRAMKKFGFYCWERTERVVPEEHIRFITNSEVEDQDVPMTEDQVFEEIKKIYDYPLRSDRPQWEVLVVPNYVYNDPGLAATKHYALVMRIHHSFMDGISAGLCGWL